MTKADLQNTGILDTCYSQQELERRIFHLKTLYEVSQEISFLKDPQKIIQNLLLMIMGNFGSFKGFIVLFNRISQVFENQTVRGFDLNVSEFFTQKTGQDFFLSLTKSVLLNAEAERKETECLSEIKEELSTNIHILIPFFVEDSHVGCIGLGEKLSGEKFSPDDAELLETIAGHGAVAIKNAILVEQMKKEENIRTNLSRYISPQVVEKIINHDVEVNLGGERKEVSVLFSDIRNFTLITESIPPDNLILILNEYFTKMVNVIFRNKGSVDKFVGDAVIAVFGSLLPTNLHATQATSAALEMMNAMRELNRKWISCYEGFSMQMGIGINTGKAFLGNIGSPERMEFTVIGDIVNVASRLSDTAKPGQILISDFTREQIGISSLQLEELDPIKFKGKKYPLKIYSVLD